MTDFGKTLTEYLESRQSFERMVILNDEKTGLEISVIIHDTTLGPALGGTRWYPFATRMEALVDNQRLARDMTYKLALALGEGTEMAKSGLGFGGWQGYRRKREEAVMLHRGRPAASSGDSGPAWKRCLAPTRCGARLLPFKALPERWAEIWPETLPPREPHLG